jgi:hypothetical protein
MNFPNVCGITWPEGGSPASCEGRVLVESLSSGLIEVKHPNRCKPLRVDINSRGRTSIYQRGEGRASRA